MSDEKKPNNFNYVLLLLIGILVVIALLPHKEKRGSIPSSTTKTGTPKSDHLELTQGQTDYVDQLIRDGYVRFSDKWAYIDLQLWNAIDVKLKEDLACCLAIYATNKAGETTYWCEVYDKMSGKKLAKWSQSWGFKVFN